MGAGAAVGAQAESIVPAESPAVARARALIGVDHVQARRLLAELRTEATAAGQTELRLTADELECRLLTDEDPPAAKAVAAQGLAAVPAAAVESLARLRLRVCHAGVVSDLGDPKAGSAELEAVIAAASAPSLLPARALARLERGLRLSRKGDFVDAQDDLLWSCQQFSALRLADDEALCLSHLAGHHKRVDEFDDALRILSGLLDGARRRGAVIDEGIHLYSIASVHAYREDWSQALHFFSDALAIETRRADPMGMSYAEQGMAEALKSLGRPGEALVRVESSLSRLDEARDPGHALHSKVLKGEILVKLNRAPEADAILGAVDADVRSTGDDMQRRNWLAAQTKAQAALGRWRAAYEAQQALVQIESQLVEQRLSRQSARLRQQFHRERDEAAIRALEASNAQQKKLRQVQWVAIGLFVLLLAASLLFAARKLGESRRLSIQALSDELTRLPNRRAVLAQADELLEAARRREAPLSVLMVDADHFKAINDHHGHAIGDQVLRELARRLSGGLRGNDRLGRIGGEEFLVLLPDASAEHAAAIAERMRQSVADEPFVTDGGRVNVTVSIGVAAREIDTLRVSDLMARADTALYGAKARGRNAVAVAPGSARAA